MLHQHHRRNWNGLRASLVAGLLAVGGCGAEAPVASTQPTTARPPAQLGTNDDPRPRPQTKEACDACGGLWAVHGIEPVKTCICRTSDGGEACVDGRECVGQCLVEEDSAFQVIAEGDPPRGFYTGTCSPYDTTFGCHLVIPPDIDSRLPLTPDEAVEHLCID